MRWIEIADDLRGRLAEGRPGAGRLLPSEAELSAEYGASRVTVRRALEALRREGLVDSRQGFGWFVVGEPLRQSLARLSTIESQLTGSGVEPERRVLDFRFVRPDARVAEVLGPGQVLEVRRLTLADGEPFARVTVWCPERLGAALSRDQVESSPFYELLSVDIGGATQTIAAAGASASDAELLAIPAGSPVLVCRRVTSDSSGRPVLFSEHVFPAHRTELVVELPQADRSIAPSGLRLVDGRTIPGSAAGTARGRSRR